MSTITKRYGLIMTLLTTGVVVLAVQLLFVAARNAYAGAPICTWSGVGADNNWSTAGNWACDSGSVPVDGTSIIFPISATNRTANNDLLASNTYTGIDFNGVGTVADENNLYTLTGNTIKLAGDIISDNTITYTSPANYPLMRINNNVIFTSNAAIDSQTSTSGIMLAGNVDFGAYAINLRAQNGYSPTLAVILGGDISGSGSVTMSGVINQQGSSANFIHNGDWTITNGTFYLGTSSSVNLIVGDNASLSYGGFTSPVTTSISFIGQPYGGVEPKFSNSVMMGATHGEDEQYYRDRFGNNITFSGQITIDSDIKIGVRTPTTLTGPISGAFTLTPYLYANQLVISSSSNTSLTPNGTYQIPWTVVTLNDSIPSNTVLVGALYTVLINGVRGDTIVYNGGILGGTGTVGSVTSTGGTVAPGNSPGVINTGSVTLDSASSYDAQIGGAALGEYDQMNVTGTVDLGGATLNASLYNGFQPTLNSQYTIIDNDGTDAITGTFNGLAQGATFAVGTTSFTINYNGGTGNDVVLTASAVPGAPNTAGVFARPTSVLLALGVIATGGGLLALRRTILVRARPAARKK